MVGWRLSAHMGSTASACGDPTHMEMQLAPTHISWEVLLSQPPSLVLL